MTRRKKEASNKYWRAYGDHVVCALGYRNFYLGGGGEGEEVADPDDIYNLWWILKIYFIKIMSKSPGRHLITKQEKLKTEKEKIYIRVFLNRYCFSAPGPI
jgi:hypothetical protein